jgi:thiol-disulfide isomerase/thioredoxin
LEAVVFVGIFLAIRAWQQRSIAFGAAPSIGAIDLGGERLDTIEGRDRPVLVHFFASWCGVCDAEEPNIVALARDHDVIAVASQSGDAERVRAWIENETALDAVRVIVDSDGSIAERWGVSAFPTGFYLSRNGEIEHVEVGYTTLLGMRLRMWSAGLSR